MAERKIGKETYRVDPLPAKRALVLFARLGKVVGPGLEGLVRAIGQRGESDAASNAAAVSALSRILETVDPETFADFVEEIAEIAEVKQGSSYVGVSFEGHFSGRLNEALPVIAFVLREQFGDFFTGLLASGRAGQRAG